LGHTFYLGTKYSSVFGAKYMPANDPSALETVHMGCYGLGLSRMIATIAQVSNDNAGIIWPESVAPWKCIVLEGKAEGSEAVYDGIASVLGTDNVLLDDRPNIGIALKLKEAKRIGYPHIVVLGRTWEDARKVEIINRRARSTEHVESAVLFDPLYWKSATS
jgi:prolyl-tRNA synthetase